MKAKKIYFSIFASMLMLFAMSVNVFASNSADVSTQADLKSALENAEVETINILGDIAFSGE